MIERFEGNGRYHNVIRWKDMLFLSGQTATEAGDTAAEQAKACLKKIDGLLEKYGSDKNHILHADVYLREQKDSAAFNQVWDAWMDAETAPTRALVVSQLGREPILVEIVVTAALAE